MTGIYADVVGGLTPLRRRRAALEAVDRAIIALRAADIKPTAGLLAQHKQLSESTVTMHVACMICHQHQEVYEPVNGTSTPGVTLCANCSERIETAFANKNAVPQ